MAMISAATAGMRKSNEEADDNDDGSESGSTKEKFIQSNHQQIKELVAILAAATVGMKKSNEEADDNDDGSGSGSTIGEIDPVQP